MSDLTPVDTSDLDEPALAKGSLMGRYVVIDELGRGGMGVVYRAYDPKLQREVALKMLHPLFSDREEQVRLQREAQAMARLTHPNVLAVYDVGTFEDRVFVAMELVEGQTLAAYLASRRLAADEIAQLYVAAGRGLAAAHDAGLVHRDFKPSNVLVGRDGRPRVLDFGLATAVGARSPAAEPEATPAGASGVADVDEASGTTPSSAGAASDPRTDGDRSLATTSPRTLHAEAVAFEDTAIFEDAPPSAGSLGETGVVLGTPKYMSPEQHRGRPTDGRSDQFSFCVALHEALYGEVPFAGDGLLQLRESVLQGRLRPAAKGARVPARMRSVLVRGLSVEPSDRYPSMTGLLDALQPPTGRGRHALLGGLAVAAIAVAVVVALRSTSSPAPVCRAGPERLADVWNPTRSAALGQHFAALGQPFEFARRGIERRGHSWEQAYTHTCEATRVHGEQSESLLDLRMACLEIRRQELDALVARLMAAEDRAVLENAAAAAAKLPSVGQCAALDGSGAWRAEEPQDAASQAALARIRTALAQARAARLVSEYDDALQLVERAVVEARAIDHAPLLAQAQVALAHVHGRRADMPASERALLAALTTAGRARDDRLLAEIWMALFYAIPYGQGRIEDIEVLQQATDAALARIGRPVRLQAHWLGTLGSMRSIQGKSEEALALHQREVELLEGQADSDDYALSGAYMSLANTLSDLERHQESIEYHKRSLDMTREILGPDHASLAHNHSNLFVSLLAARDLDQAVVHAERSLELWRQRFGERNPFTGQGYCNRGMVRKERGELADGRRDLELCLNLWQEMLGPTHFRLGAVHLDLADIAVTEDRWHDAESHFRGALTAGEKTRAPWSWRAHHGLGRVHRAAGRTERAREAMERALAGATAARPGELAPLAFDLAQALQGHDDPRATALAERALAGYRTLGDEGRGGATSVEAFLQRVRGVAGAPEAGD